MTAALLVALVAVVAWLAVEIARRGNASSAARHREAEWLPTEMRRGHLLLAEPRAMRIDTPVKAAAKVDRAYRVDRGVIPVELKTRRQHRVYDADIIELSVQRLVLEGNGVGNVPDTAYVLTAHPDNGSRRLHTVRLIPRDHTAALVRRYQTIRGGREPGQKTDDPRRCMHCGHLLRCRPELADPRPR